MAATPGESAPKELVYERDNHGRKGFGVAMLQIVSVPLVVCVVLSMAVGGNAALIGLAVSTVGVIYWWKRKPPGEGRILRIEGKTLVVSQLNGQKTERIPLDDVLGVELDIETVERIQDGSSAIPAMRFIDSTVAPPVDTALIVLSLKNGVKMRLGKDYHAHMDATEWVGKIRVFLRKNAWLPEDERESPESAPESAPVSSS